MSNVIFNWNQVHMPLYVVSPQKDMLNPQGMIKVMFTSLITEPRKNKSFKRAIKVRFDKEYVYEFIKNRFSTFSKEDLIALIQELN